MMARPQSPGKAVMRVAAAHTCTREEIDRAWRSIYTRAINDGRQPADAEDMAQDRSLAALEHQAEGHTMECLASWAANRRVVRQRLIDVGRERAATSRGQERLGRSDPQGAHTQAREMTEEAQEWLRQCAHRLVMDTLRKTVNESTRQYTATVKREYVDGGARVRQPQKSKEFRWLRQRLTNLLDQRPEWPVIQAYLASL
jgi:hypothetical protein